jgi:preprotein translocase subunit SecG
MQNLQLFLLIVQIIVAILLIISVLLQKSDGDSLSGIGGGSGGMNSIISSKSSANAISKFTMILIAIFMLNCLILAKISNYSKTNIQEKLEKTIQEESSKTSEIEADKEAITIENKDAKNIIPEVK